MHWSGWGRYFMAKKRRKDKVKARFECQVRGN